VAPLQRIVLELDCDSFEQGSMSLDSIVNVEHDECLDDKGLRREAAATLLNMLLLPTVGGALPNGSSGDESENILGRKDRIYQYKFKDPQSPGNEYPSFTVHYEEVLDQNTHEVFKHRLWYLVWDPEFTVAKSVGYILTVNQYEFKDAHALGAGSGKKRAAVRATIIHNEKNVNTRMFSIIRGEDLHTEFRKYFGDRSAKVDNMRMSEYSADVVSLGTHHQCALEKLLDPLDDENGPTVLDSVPRDDTVQINPDQLDVTNYFDQHGRFRPPEATAHMFHTLHPKHVGQLSVRTQRLPCSGDRSELQRVLVDHFATVKLSRWMPLDRAAQLRSFEAYIAGADYNPVNNTTSRKSNEATNTSRYAFSSDRHKHKFADKNGVKTQIKPFDEIRERLDRLHCLIAVGAEKRTAEMNDALHRAARDVAVKEMRVAMEQRSKQVAVGTANYYREGNSLLKRLGSPFSKTRGTATTRDYDLFGVMINRFYAFSRNSMGAHEPFVFLLYHINSMASSLEGVTYKLAVYGPTQTGKSEMRVRASTLDLPGMNQMMQVQSNKSGLRENHEDGYHVTFDEMPIVYESLKIKNKTAEQLEAINREKKRITDHQTTHSFPEEKMGPDGERSLAEVKVTVENRQATTMNNNGPSVFGVTQFDDNTTSLLNRVHYYGFFTKHVDGRGRPCLMKNVTTVAEREDIQKNQFLTRLLLSFGIISPEFEVDCTVANEIFRRMDMADGRPLPESRAKGQRLELFRVFTTWFAVHCVFEFENYHDLMPELFVDGNVDQPKPWKLEMMELCIPWLKTPNESLIQFVWHVNDTVTMGRGPVADEVMSLLVKEAKLKPSMYSKLAPRDKPDKALAKSKDEEDREEYAKDMKELISSTKESHKASVSQKNAPLTYQHLATMYSEDTIEDVLKMVDCDESNLTDADKTILAGMRTKEKSAIGQLSFYTDKHMNRTAPQVDWNLVTLGYRTIPDLAVQLSRSIDRRLEMDVDVIKGQLYLFKGYVQSFTYEQTNGGNVVVCESNISYIPSKNPSKRTSAHDSSATSKSVTNTLIDIAVNEYDQFPAIFADGTLSNRKDYVLTSKHEAPTQKSDKLQKSDGGEQQSEFGICVQHAAIKKHMLEEEQGRMYIDGHPQLGKCSNPPIYRHGVARLKRIADLVFDMPPNLKMVGPFFEKNIVEPIYVTTTEEVDPSVWSITSTTECPLLSTECITVINGKAPMHSEQQRSLTRDFSTPKTSTLWTMCANETLNAFGWSDDKWLKIMLDARRNTREHSRDTVYSIPMYTTAATSSSSSQSSEWVMVDPGPLNI